MPLYIVCTFVQSTKLCFAFQKIKKAMSDSSVYCNLCCCVIGMRNETVLLLKGWKQFDIFIEIESLEISLRSIGNKYVCRNCVAKLKKTSITYQENENNWKQNGKALVQAKAIWTSSSSVIAIAGNPMVFRVRIWSSKSDRNGDSTTRTLDPRGFSNEL